MLDEPHTLRRLMEVQRYVSVYLSGEGRGEGHLVVTQLCFIHILQECGGSNDDTSLSSLLQLLGRHCLKWVLCTLVGLSRNCSEKSNVSGSATSCYESGRPSTI